MTQADVTDFKAGIRDGAYLFLKPKPKKSSPKKRKSTKRSYNPPTSLGGLR